MLIKQQSIIHIGNVKHGDPTAPLSLDCPHLCVWIAACVLMFVVLANNLLLPMFDILPIGFKTYIIHNVVRPYMNCMGVVRMVVSKVACIAKSILHLLHHSNCCLVSRLSAPLHCCLGSCLSSSLL